MFTTYQSVRDLWPRKRSQPNESGDSCILFIDKDTIYSKYGRGSFLLTFEFELSMAARTGVSALRHKLSSFDVSLAIISLRRFEIRR